jgi:hypothetical protein
VHGHALQWLHYTVPVRASLAVAYRMFAVFGATTLMGIWHVTLGFNEKRTGRWRKRKTCSYKFLFRKPRRDRCVRVRG